MKWILQCFFLLILTCSTFCFLNAQNLQLNAEQKQAIAYIDSVENLNQSIYWPKVKPQSFIRNIRENVKNPLLLYAGSNTNFCGYAAMSYSCISNYPLHYVEFMMKLYINGVADFRDIQFTPSNNIKQTAGLLKFKGELDIHPADQIWFLTLADHFKGYLNWLFPKYHQDDENGFWASTNFAKFNRMIKKMCNYEVHSVGSDLIKPSIEDIPKFLNEKLASNHQVFIYLNNTVFHKKNHTAVKRRIPTHFIVLFSVTEIDDMINLVYWDYGFKTLRQISTTTFKDIVFGITWCKKNTQE